MKIAPVPANEHERLKALKEYAILDTVQEADFDDITRLASEICQTPVSLVSIVDAHRQWFKSRHGLITPEISRDFAFCAHAINAPDDLYIIPDLTKDERFHDNPLVKGEPHVVFYAGIRLINPEGFALGTLCVWDKKPRELDATQIITLKALARQIMSQLELRKKIQQLKHSQEELQNAYADLENFSAIASHDLKSPLNNIISLTQLVRDNYSDKLDEEGNEYIHFLQDSAYQLSDLITGILNYSRASQLLTQQREDINVAELIEEITSLIKIPTNTTIVFEKGEKKIHTSRIALKQILLNLIDNAIKYNDKGLVNIEIGFSEVDGNYVVEIKDNGLGIADEDRERIFELFKKLQSKSKDGSMGVGLAIVKRLVKKLGGTIEVNSELSKGTSFVITIPK
jgi:signal transduction histidine kinase